MSCRAAFLAGAGEGTKKKKKKYYIEIAGVGLMLELLACVPSDRGRVRRGDGGCVCAGRGAPPSHRPYFWNSHSVLSRGQTWRVFSQREMQWKWKAWLHTPQATVHSSVVALAWFAWHSMPAGG